MSDLTAIDVLIDPDERPPTMGSSPSWLSRLRVLT
jgi:hypothetical protein